MTYHNAEKYISSAPKETSGKHSFDRTEYLCTLLNIPYKKINYVRLAGSNGKTICSALLSSVLSKAGYNVCTLNMSDLSDPKENVRRNTLPMTVSEFSETVSEISAACTLMKRNIEAAQASVSDTEDIPEEYRGIPLALIKGDISAELTRSEILLAAALLFYKKQGSNLLIIESAHNSIDPSLFMKAPFAAVICGTIPNGDNKQISKIKNYIRKGTGDVVSAPQDSYAYKIISDTCASVNCRLTVPIRSSLTIKQLSLTGTRFLYQGEEYKLSLCGRFQTTNAITVIETLKVLRRHGYKISDEAEKQGISAVRIRSRFEVLSVHPTIIADSTYKEEAVETMCESLFDFSEFTGRSLRLCLPDDASLTESYLSMLSSRGYTVASIYTVANPEQKSREKDEASRYNPPLSRFATPKAAAKHMIGELGENDTLLISGKYSFTDPIRLEIMRYLEF
ncbi:MAG: hypothetical protein IJ038_04015 [Clostridia bacterium]|nr:hypothetical protein [Clostridia bacterium]